MADDLEAELARFEAEINSLPVRMRAGPCALHADDSGQAAWLQR